MAAVSSIVATALVTKWLQGRKEKKKHYYTKYFHFFQTFFCFLPCEILNAVISADRLKPLKWDNMRIHSLRESYSLAELLPPSLCSLSDLRWGVHKQILASDAKKKKSLMWRKMSRGVSAVTSVHGDHHEEMIHLLYKTMTKSAIFSESID